VRCRGEVVEKLSCARRCAWFAGLRIKVRKTRYMVPSFFFAKGVDLAGEDGAYAPRIAYNACFGWVIRSFGASRDVRAK
jgi:hypothetical protein